VQVKKGITFEQGKTTADDQTKGYARPTKSARGQNRKKIDDADAVVAELMRRKLPSKEVFSHDIRDPRQPPPPEKDMHGEAIRENQLKLGRQKFEDNQSDLQKAEKARQKPLPTTKPANLPKLKKKK